MTSVGEKLEVLDLRCLFFQGLWNTSMDSDGGVHERVSYVFMFKTLLLLLQLEI